MNNAIAANQALPVRVREIEQQLTARLQPTVLEVLDESAASCCSISRTRTGRA